MGEVVELRAVEVDADPRIASMAETLSEALEDVRAGRFEGVAIMLVSGSGVSTRWAMSVKDGHGHLLASAASRLLHDLNATADAEFGAAEEDGA